MVDNAGISDGQLKTGATYGQTIVIIFVAVTDELLVKGSETLIGAKGQKHADERQHARFVTEAAVGRYLIGIANNSLDASGKEANSGVPVRSLR